MDKKVIELREEKLSLDKKIKYKNKRNSYGGRFGKDFLFDKFNIGLNKLKKNGNFETSFKTYIEIPLLDKTFQGNITSKTRKSLMGLFSKFCKFNETYQNEIEKIIGEGLNDGKNTQREIKNSIFTTLSLDNPKLLEKNIEKTESMLNPREKEYMSIDEDGNILPPIENNDII